MWKRKRCKQYSMNVKNTTPTTTVAAKWLGGTPFFVADHTNHHNIGTHKRGTIHHGLRVNRCSINTTTSSQPYFCQACCRTCLTSSQIILVLSKISIIIIIIYLNHQLCIISILYCIKNGLPFPPPPTNCNIKWKIMYIS